MFELTYKDNYHVERTLKYEDYEAPHAGFVRDV